MASVKRLGLGVAIALGVGIAIISLAFFNIRASLAAAREVSRTHEVMSVLAETLVLVENAESSMRAYVITGQPVFRDESLIMRGAIESNLEQLRGIVRDATVRRRLADLESAIVARLDHIDRVFASYDSQGFESARLLVAQGEGKRAMDHIFAGSAAIQADERRLLGERHRNSERQARRTMATAAGGAVFVSILVGIIYSLARRDRIRSSVRPSSFSATS